MEKLNEVQVRFLNEKWELRKRVTRLEQFLKSEKYKLLDKKQRRLLKKQYRVMRKYYIILRKRKWF